MKRFILFLSALFAFINAQALPIAAAHNEKNEVKQMLKKYRVYWNRGDLNDFLKAYKTGNNTVLITDKQLIQGYGAITSYYHQRYQNKNDMGTLHLESLHLIPIDSSHFFVYGKYEILLKKEKYQGYSSLLLVKLGDQWKIVNEHS